MMPCWVGFLLGKKLLIHEYSRSVFMHRQLGLCNDSLPGAEGLGLHRAEMGPCEVD